MNILHEDEQWLLTSGGRCLSTGGEPDYYTMDARTRKFIQEAVQTVAGLDVVLYLQDNPDTFDTAAGLALRLRREVEQVQPALVRLADNGILDVHIRGDGQYRCYSLVRTRAVWDLLCRVSEAYMDDPETQKEIVRLLIARSAQTPPDTPAGPDAK